MHTPGPWTLTETTVRIHNGEAAAYHLHGEDGKSIGYIHRDPRDKENESNAVLACAAPRLIECLQSIVEMWDSANRSPLGPLRTRMTAKIAAARAAIDSAKVSDERYDNEAR